MNDVDIPMYVHSKANATPAEINFALREMHKSEVIGPYLAFFTRLAQYPPPLRLAINLKSMFGIAAKRDIDDLMLHTLTDAERYALLELDKRHVLVQAKEIAHGLLNIHERWIVWKAVSRPIREAHIAKDNHIPTGWEKTHE